MIISTSIIIIVVILKIDIWCNNAGINANHGWRLCLEVIFFIIIMMMIIIIIIIIIFIIIIIIMLLLTIIQIMVGNLAWMGI